MTHVYLLRFVREKQNRNNELLIGGYSTESEAKAAIERLKDRPGFREFPKGFEIHPYRLNQDNWTKGFVLD